MGLIFADKFGIKAYLDDEKKMLDLLERIKDRAFKEYLAEKRRERASKQVQLTF